MAKVPSVFIRTAYNYDRDAASDESGLQCLDKSLAKQEFAEEVDINTIVRRFGLTGELPSDVRMPLNVDFEGVFDFQSAMNQLIEARLAFEAMPADVRSRFDNDPGKFVSFCSDDSNSEEAEKLGLVRAEVAQVRSAARQAKAKAEFDAAVAAEIDRRKAGASD